MEKFFSAQRLSEFMSVVHMGLWALWTDVRWFLGPDRHFTARLVPMRKEYSRLSGQLARLATLADPRRDAVAANLALLEEDLRQLELDRVASFAEAHAGLRARFAHVLK